MNIRTPDIIADILRTLEHNRQVLAALDAQNQHASDKAIIIELREIYELTSSNFDSSLPT